MGGFSVERTLRGAIYGKVVLARHVASERRYAIKMMSLAHMAAQRAVSGPFVCEDGTTELRILRRISGNRVVGEGDRSRSVHPLWETWGCEPRGGAADHHFLITLHCDFVDESAGARCLVFDFCPHGELYDQLQRTPPKALGVETARACFLQIATAVRFIHSLNIAHRDLSLENVLLDAARQCRLGDFGLACEYGTMCSGRVGKAFYMAPEVFAWQPGELYDGLKADMWSLGILLFVMVTGAPPFESPHAVDARFRVAKDKGIGALIAMWKLDLKLPYALRDLLTMLLTVDSDERVDIETLWTHPWMQDPVDTQALAVEGDFTGRMAGVHAAEDEVANSSRAGGDEDDSDEGDEVEDAHEPQEEMEAEAAVVVKRRRKRIKITIEDNAYAVGAMAVDRVAGFCASGFDSELVRTVGLPPTLRHESPNSGDARVPSPRASPMVWPKVGMKTALRRLFLRPAMGLVDDGEADAIEYEEKEDAAIQSRRRPRLDSSSSCSSCSSGSSSTSNQHPTAFSFLGEKEPKVTAAGGATLCRFCLRWVASDQCGHRVTLPTEAPDREQRSKTRRVCDACFLTISASLDGSAWGSRQYRAPQVA